MKNLVLIQLLIAILTALLSVGLMFITVAVVVVSALLLLSVTVVIAALPNPVCAGRRTRGKQERLNGGVGVATAAARTVAGESELEVKPTTRA